MGEAIGVSEGDEVVFSLCSVIDLDAGELLLFIADEFEFDRTRTSGWLHLLLVFPWLDIVDMCGTSRDVCVIPLLVLRVVVFNTGSLLL